MKLISFPRNGGFCIESHSHPVASRFVCFFTRAKPLSTTQMMSGMVMEVLKSSQETGHVRYAAGQETPYAPCMVYYLPTWMVDLYGKWRVNIPYMDPMGTIHILQIHIFETWQQSCKSTFIIHPAISFLFQAILPQNMFFLIIYTCKKTYTMNVHRNLNKCRVTDRIWKATGMTCTSKQFKTCICL